MDFKGFELVDKHTQGGQGDFHLHFEDFDVLVDAKNYKKKVPVDQREKIKKDLIKNEHINFAWLVSLNTSIDKYDKSPIMYEWISTSQCIVYINHLSSFEDPKKILRIVWFTCKELYKLTADVHFDESELTELKDKNFKLMDKIKSVRKTIREINTSMNATRNFIQVMDDELRGILEAETNSIVTSNISLFDDWWEQNIEITNDENSVSSSTLWIDFKQENKMMINEMNITGDKFKNYLKSKVPLSSIQLRNKSVNAAFDIKGICLKTSKNKVIENDKIELELVEEVLKKKNPNKAIKGSKKGEGVIPKAEAVIETVGSVPLQTLKIALQSLKDEGHIAFTPQNFDEISNRLDLKKPNESPLKTARTIDEALEILNTNYAPRDSLALSSGGGGPRN
jgi:hypothetical protein